MALAAILMLNVSSAFAYEYTENWSVTSFESEITIQQNGDVQVKETINADFTDEAHRGIERMIPYKYTTGYNSEIRYLSSVNEKGVSYSTDTYKQGGYLYVPMRTPNNELLTGPASFILSYITKNSITFFEDGSYPHDEFYWNVNGTDWVVPIDQVSATVHLPKDLSDEELNINCITGKYAERGDLCKWTRIDADTIKIESTTPFSDHEGMTIVVGMPYGTITQPTLLERIWWMISENYILLLPVITLIIMLSIWFKYGRDDQTVRDTIMPQYTPPKDLLPSEVGTIIDEKLDPKDIIATIIDFAVKGFIRITELKEKGLLFSSTDYELELLKPYETNKIYEATIMAGIFSSNKAGSKIKISELKNKFFAQIPIIKKQISEGLIKDDYFKHNPHSIRAGYLTAGLTVAGIGWSFAGAFSVAAVIAVIASGLIVTIIGYQMPRKTRKGTETYYHLKGLHEFINTAEKDRMKFQEKNNILFEKLLPYAMAFGLISKWTKAFDGIIQNPPGWYSPYGGWGTGRPFTMIYFADSMTSVATAMTNNMLQAPGSKGGNGGWSGGSGFSGGFSGGGFGGGGGRGL